MTTELLLQILGYIWGAFGVYWIAAGLKSARSRTHEARIYRFGRLSVLAITFLLLFWNRTSIGILGRRVVPSSLPLAYTGFIATLIGIAAALWARVHLGQYWSDKVILKVDHRLIRSGPYAYVRHPIYSGVLLGVFGTALVLGQLRGAVAFALLLTNYVIKAKREDQLLAAHFAEEFCEHSRRAGFLLPQFHL
jgi:protein-S-isoprenylcysteine O-methyltransferase Ste14